jgi:hypothetical protein
VKLAPVGLGGRAARHKWLFALYSEGRSERPDGKDYLHSSSETTIARRLGFASGVVWTALITVTSAEWRHESSRMKCTGRLCSRTTRNSLPCGDGTEV